MFPNSDNENYINHISNDNNQNVNNVIDFSERKKENIETGNPEVFERLDFICKDLNRARYKKLAKISSENNQKSFVRDITKQIFKSNVLPFKKETTEKDLITQESIIGGRVFGQVAKNERREFFYYDEDSDGNCDWFYHEEFTDENSVVHTRTLHYEVCEISPGQKVVLLIGHKPLSGEELQKFITATETYHDRVMGQLYYDVIHDELNNTDATSEQNVA